MFDKRDYLFVSVACKFPDISVSGYKLERIKSCKLLGVLISEHLKWNDHFKHPLSGCYATPGVVNL